VFIQGLHYSCIVTGLHIVGVTEIILSTDSHRLSDVSVRRFLATIVQVIYPTS